ncbi:hypothetical protein Daus18300_003924 [Diaporthe australafricana]|uniref:Uncharacterized protein n=1 Tax=Diaporthe australafricana TaxID=127596 RepID=A0ABR3XD63_9PEZI
MSTDLIGKLLAKMSNMDSQDMLPPKVEHGEAPSSDVPPFPRYSIEPEYPIMTDSPRNLFGRPFTPGPVPAPGTPQDRFAAVLGRSRYTSLPAPVLGMDLNTSTPFSTPINQPPSAFHNYMTAPGVLGPGALPTAQPPPGPVASGMRKPQAAPTIFRSNNLGGGRGPTLPEPGAPVTTWLSFECQRRHFNPEFQTKESLTKDGRPKYQSTVIVKDVVISSNALFDDPSDAKAHIADKALKYVRREWPKHGSTTSRGGIAGAPTIKKQGDDLGRRREELRQVLKQRHQTKTAEPLLSSPSVSSGVDMTDPEQARAFVEGFKIGQLAAQREAAGISSSPSDTSLMRRRSRSPAHQNSSSQGKSDEAYRQRSPVRDATKRSRGAPSPPRYFDGSRHDVRLPSTDRYRPRSPPPKK